MNEQKITKTDPDQFRPKSLEDTNLETIQKIWESLASQHKPPSSTQQERANQYERRQTKRKQKKEQKPIQFSDPNLTIDSLVSTSPCAEQIFDTLAKLDVPDGNPLLGIKLLVKLPEALQLELYHLIHFPFLIVESLLMYQKMNELSLILTDHDFLRDSDLIMTYALKALAYPDVSPNLLFGRPDIHWRERYVLPLVKQHSDFTYKPLVPETLLIYNYTGKWSGKLTGITPENDEKIRSTHFYDDGTPNESLSIAILNLSKPKELAQNILDLCDTVSEEINKDNQLLMSQIIRNLLNYAKSIFLQENNEAKSNLCESYMRDMEMLSSLLLKQCKIKVSLMDLGDMSRVRFIRDSLVKEGKLELAFKLTANYMLDAEPVWAAWGMSLLRSGQFEAAKEKFKYCFNTRVPRQNVTILLQGILHALETVPDDLGVSSDESLPPRIFNANTLETRLKHSIYYLSEYGLPQHLVKFLVVNEKYGEAMSVIIDKQMPVNVFVDEVIVYCLNNNCLHILREQIKQIDPTLTKSNSYLLAACTYLNKTNNILVLLDFQEFMNDHPRAALTCIKIYIEHSVENKDIYLEKSKYHFMEELMKISEGNKPSLINETEINRYLKKIKFQTEVTRYFSTLSDIPDSIKTASLFGSPKQRMDITEYVLQNANFDLGVTLILTFDLPPAQVLSGAIAVLAKKNTESVEGLVNRAATLMSTAKEWDKFLISCIKFLTEAGSSQLATKLVEHIKLDENKVDGYINCGMLKSAYLAAVRSGQREKIVQIRDEALAKNMMTEFRLCEGYLSLEEKEQTITTTN